jgi:nucleoside diphosphate kinase
MHARPVVGRHGPEIPRHLACSTTKLALYAVDLYFWESWEDLRQVAAADTDGLVWSHAFLLVKPDGIAARKSRPALRWLDEHGFTVCAAESFRLDRHVPRAIWAYQWNIASRERKDLFDLLLALTDSLFLMLRGPAGDVPATVVLSDLKGPADPALRRSGQLRHALGPRNFLLNFVHMADDPLDLVREIGVYFDAEVRTRIYRQALDRHDARRAAEHLAERLEAQVAERDLLLPPALTRLRERASAGPRRGRRATAWRELRELSEAVSGGASRDWQRLLCLADHVGIVTDVWDRIVIGTYLMDASVAGREPVLEAVSADDWRRAHGPR